MQVSGTLAARAVADETRKTNLSHQTFVASVGHVFLHLVLDTSLKNSAPPCGTSPTHNTTVQAFYDGYLSHGLRRRCRYNRASSPTPGVKISILQGKDWHEGGLTKRVYLWVIKANADKIKYKSLLEARPEKQGKCDGALEHTKCSGYHNTKEGPWIYWCLRLTV